MTIQNVFLFRYISHGGRNTVRKSLIWYRWLLFFKRVLKRVFFGDLFVRYMKI